VIKEEIERVHEQRSTKLVMMAKLHRCYRNSKYKDFCSSVHRGAVDSENHLVEIPSRISVFISIEYQIPVIGVTGAYGTGNYKHNKNGPVHAEFIRETQRSSQK